MENENVIIIDNPKDFVFMFQCYKWYRSNHEGCDNSIREDWYYCPYCGKKIKWTSS
jgi:hypothetical protein